MKIDKRFWIRLGVAGVLVLAIVILSTIVSDLRYKLRITEHNYHASESELTETKLKNDALLYEKQAFILNEKDMLEQLEVSKKEINDLSRNLSDKIAYISKLESDIRIDTVYMPKDSIIYEDNTPRYVFFRNEDKWLKLSGKTDLLQKSTYLYDIKIPVPLVIGITEAKSVFIKTENPYLSISDINAVAIEDFVRRAEKKRKWAFGLNFGVGPQYDFIHNTLGFGLNIGIGLNYNF